MRKVIELGYGQKSAITIKNNIKKIVDYKVSMGGVAYVVISNYIKGEVYGWVKTNSHTTQLN